MQPSTLVALAVLAAAYPTMAFTIPTSSAASGSPASATPSAPPHFNFPGPCRQVSPNGPALCPLSSSPRPVDLTTVPSGALSFGDLKNIGSIVGDGISIFNNLFGGLDQQQQRRDVAELVARDFVEGLVARADYVQSGAFSLEDAKNIASIGDSLSGIFNDIFGNNNKRELVDFLTRAVASKPVHGVPHVLKMKSQMVNAPGPKRDLGMNNLD